MVVVLLCLYLGTIVAANVLVAKVGPAAIGPVSFVLIHARPRVGGLTGCWDERC